MGTINKAAFFRRSQLPTSLPQTSEEVFGWEAIHWKVSASDLDSSLLPFEVFGLVLAGSRSHHPAPGPKLRQAANRNPGHPPTIRAAFAPPAARPPKKPFNLWMTTVRGCSSRCVPLYFLLIASSRCPPFRRLCSRKNAGFEMAFNRMDPTRDSRSLLYSKVEHVFALPEGGTCPCSTRKRNMSAEPTRRSQTSRRRNGVVRWEPDAGSPAFDKVFFPKEILPVSSNLSCDNGSAGTLRAPERA